jgi:hypothetical protein
MSFKMMKGVKGGYWFDKSSGNLDLMTKQDKITVTVFAVSLAACLLATMLIILYTELKFFEIAVLITTPFFLLGMVSYLRGRRWIILAVTIAVSAALYFFLRIDPTILFFIVFTMIGSVGVVSLVVVLQRLLFYRILHSVEYLNVKEKMSVWDKGVAFLFNIPRDLDTRNLTMDYNLKRASIPWGEIKETMSLGLMIGIFLWIYISMNPAFMDITSFSNAPLYIFSLVLYIPVIVMPWSIFRSLNVRIETKYRDFTLYSGIKETLKRMVVPMFAAFMFILIAVNENGLVSVFGFIALSVIMNMVIIGLTSAIYYTMFESKIVDDIVSKWRAFRPVSITVGVETEKKRKEYPGTPKRDMSDFGELVFPDESSGIE